MFHTSYTHFSQKNIVNQPKKWVGPRVIHLSAYNILTICSFSVLPDSLIKSNTLTVLQFPCVRSVMEYILCPFT